MSIKHFMLCSDKDNGSGTARGGRGGGDRGRGGDRGGRGRGFTVF